jgi:PhnB protein
MSDAKSKSGGFLGVIPMLVCLDAAAEIDFCKTAFGAAELSRRTAPNGAVIHATLRIGPAIIMVHDDSPHLASRAPQSDGSSSVVIYLYVEDADTVMERAVAAGARILLPAENQFWGDRVGRIIDPSGHVWNVAARIKKASPEEGRNASAPT